MGIRSKGGRSVRAAVGRRLILPHGGRKRKRGKREAPISEKERCRLIRMAVCSGVFVLLVAAKLLLPAKMSGVNQKISNALEQNMDVQAVFSAVGELIAGKEQIDQTAAEVYQAVFNPGEVQESSDTADAVEVLYFEPMALDKLQTHIPQTKTEDGGATEENAELSSVAYVLYSEENLSENVSLEQAILGFDYSSPVRGKLTSNFGYRDHPVEGDTRFHYGLDLAADYGTAVSCFADGTVTAVGESSSYGKYCTVLHEGGFSTLYAHCSRITASSGAAVSGGEKIAEVGDTGIATGPHLHFELLKDGAYINPIYYVETI